MKKRITTIITSIIISLIGICAGYIIGTTISHKYFSYDKYKNFDIQSLYDDITKLNTEISPMKNTALNCYLISINKLETSAKFSIETEGVLDTSLGMQQTTSDLFEKNNDTYSDTFCTLSKLIKKAGKCSYKVGEDVNVYNGELNGPSYKNVKWLDSYKHYTYDEYAKNIGYDPTKTTAYIISSKTLLSESITKTPNGTYICHLVLDPELTVIQYRNQIAHQSGLEASTIKFKSIELILEINENYDIISKNATEVYTLNYSGINVTLNATYNSKIYI